MILQYYVIESVTGKHINIEVDAASKDDWRSPGAAGRPSGTQILFLTLRKKSTLPKPKRVKSLRWVLTVFGKEA